MNMEEIMREELQSGYSQPLLFADGFDDCIIGTTDDFGTIRVVYCVDKMIESLVSQGDSYEDAREYLEFNTLTAWVGERTPVYVESQ
tara:strand:- start:20 stop:280 length:261 start_codon:yes stop_codon:yes gene_type:complete